LKDLKGFEGIKVKGIEGILKKMKEVEGS